MIHWVWLIPAALAREKANPFGEWIAGELRRLVG